MLIYVVKVVFCFVLFFYSKYCFSYLCFIAFSLPLALASSQFHDQAEYLDFALD